MRITCNRDDFTELEKEGGDFEIEIVYRRETEGELVLRSSFA